VIYIKHLLYYGKTIIYFIIVQIFVAFVLSFFELFGMDSGLLHLISLLSNILIYYIVGYKYGKKTNRKAWIEGLILGSILNGILLIINILFFGSLSLLSIIYYLILYLFIIIGSIIGKNNKKESTLNKK